MEEEEEEGALGTRKERSGVIIGQAQCFLIAVVLGAAIGARRGWHREVITAAIVLGTVFFLSLGGGNALAQWLTHNIIGTASAHGFIASGGTNPPPSAGTPQDPLLSQAAPSTSCTFINPQLLSTVIFVGMTWLGYGVGKKYGQPPKSQAHNLAGIIPGGINGGAIAYYVSNAVLPSQPLLVETPSPTLTASYLPLVFGVGLLAVLALLFVAGQFGKGGK